jgi:hypothetical protein
MIPEKCTQATTDSIIKVSEKKSRHTTFLNQQREEYKKIAYDGCCKINETACDWLVVKNDVGTLAIELKGADIDHACVQIEKALDDVRKDSTLPQKLAGLIVCTRVPKIDTKLQRAKNRLAKNYKAPLLVKEDARNLVFSDLFTF